MSKSKNHEEEMILSSTPPIKLRLVRDFPSKEPKCLIVCHHGIAMNLHFFDKFAKEMNEANIAIYRLDARGHGKSEGKRGHSKSIFDMVEDLKIIVDLAKKENPKQQIFVLGHSMGGHVSALFGTKYPNEVKGIILAAGLLKDTMHLFGELPIKGDPETYIPTNRAFKAKEIQSVPLDVLDKSYPYFVRELTISILNSFVEGFEYLKKNNKNFVVPVLIFNGNADYIVDQKDAIEFYMETGNKDKSLIIFSGVGHEFWNEEKGDNVIKYVLDWVQRRLK